MLDDIVRLFREAPILMGLTCILGGAIGAVGAVWQNQPKLNAIDKELATLKAELAARKDPLP